MCPSYIFVTPSTQIRYIPTVILQLPHELVIPKQVMKGITKIPCLHIRSKTGLEGSKLLIHTKPSNQPNQQLELYALDEQKAGGWDHSIQRYEHDTKECLSYMCKSQSGESLLRVEHKTKKMKENHSGTRKYHHDLD
ncbi:hypothetical protein M9H77_17266 [Catharanthus roseus]|uniref:Uncharacterized protein n=1 Tax=Catharanthus roseus TaxID=4058 RepID=A0ACC0B439_CATRO|nr:hypothetical protein M9H77_17266 [Catharanthus roseus]